MKNKKQIKTLKKNNPQRLGDHRVSRTRQGILWEVHWITDCSPAGEFHKWNLWRHCILLEDCQVLEPEIFAYFADIKNQKRQKQANKQTKTLGQTHKARLTCSTPRHQILRLTLPCKPPFWIMRLLMHRLLSKYPPELEIDSWIHPIRFKGLFPLLVDFSWGEEGWEN